MDTRLSDDQVALEDYCGHLLGKEWPRDQMMKCLGPQGDGHSAKLWKTLADAGWLALALKPEVGGAGGSIIDLGLVYRAAGYSLVPSSFYSTTFAALLIERIAGTGAAKDLLAPIIEGSALASVAYAEQDATDNHQFWETTATWTGTAWRLSGSKAFVENCHVADFVLVLARIRSGRDRLGWGLFKVMKEQLFELREHGSFGSERRFSINLDGTILAGDALLGGLEAAGSTLEAFLAAREAAAALQCMEMVGGTQSMLDQTIAYVSEREVLGRKVGVNQSVQHMLADVWIYLNGARTAALHALHRISTGKSAEREVAIAKIALGKCYTEMSIKGHQLWGSMGYARETGLYLWSERAKVTDVWNGTRHTHALRLMAAMGI